MSDSLPPHGLQPTRLLCPRDFPGKSPGVGCHWLLPFISSSACMSIPVSQFIPRPHQLVSLNYFLYVWLHFCFANRSICTIFLDSTYKLYYTKSFSFRFTLLSMTISRSIHVVANGIISSSSFFFFGWEIFHSVQFSQPLSCVQLFGTPWTAARQVSQSISNFQSFLKLSPLSHWSHPTIWSSVIPFSCCLQSFPASGSFQMSQLFASGG